MGFIDCLKEKLKNNEVSARKVNDLERTYNSLVDKYTKTMSSEDAAVKAAQDIADIEAAKLLREKKNELKAVLFEKKILEDLDGKPGPYYRKTADLYEKAHVRGKTVQKQILLNIEDFVQEFRSKFAGLTQRQDGMKEVVRELLGEQSGNAEAKTFAEAIRKAFDLAHLRLKTAGGEIGKLDNYFPQTHRREALSQVSFDEWRAEILPLLDREKMVDINTGLPFTDERLLEMMKGDYEAILSGGKSEIQRAAREGKISGFGKKDIAYRRDSARFYHFKDSESYFTYNNKFGYGDEGLFDAIMGHVEFMSRDIGILETLGPRPDRLQRSLDNRMLGDAETSDLQKAWVNGMYSVLTNRFSGQSDSWWAKALGSTQNLMRAAYLGSAPVSALTDSFYVVGTAKMAGLSGVKAAKRYMRLMNPASGADRKIAARAGYLAEIATGDGLAEMRWTGEIMGRKGVFAKMSNFVNRASGLNIQTKNAADVLAMEIEGNLADLVRAGKSFDEIEEPFRKAMTERGIGPEEWETIRKAEIITEPETGAEFLRSQEIVKVGESAEDLARSMDIANKIDDWIFAMRAVATNEPSLRTRSITTGAITGAKDSQALVKAIFGSATMFKSFPITVLFNHTIPMFRAAREGKLDPRAVGVLGATLMGGFVIQAKDIIKGKEPREWDNPEFFAAAMLQGGGMGLFGDFLFQDASRFGRSPVVEFATGPVGGLASDIFRATKGNFDKAVTGEDLTFATDIFKLVKRNVPGVNLWYSRLVVERLLFDQMEKAIDPNFHRKVRKTERKMQKELGQGYWWRKGETSPNF